MRVLYWFGLGMIIFVWANDVRFAQQPDQRFLRLNQLSDELLQAMQDLEQANPFIVVLGIVNDLSGNRDEVSIQAETVLVEFLKSQGSITIVEYSQVQSVREEWLSAFPDSTPDELNRNIANILGADGFVTGAYRTIDAQMEFQLQLYDTLTEQEAWQGQTKTFPPHEEESLIEPSLEPLPDTTIEDPIAELLPETLPELLSESDIATTATLATSLLPELTTIPPPASEEPIPPSTSVAATTESAEVIPEYNLTVIPKRIDDLRFIGPPLALHQQELEPIEIKTLVEITFLVESPPKHLKDLSYIGPQFEKFQQDPPPQQSEVLEETLPLEAEAPMQKEGMVLIAAGVFRMGSDHGEADEQPVHWVSLDSYYLDTHEVTNVEYARCDICERGSGGFDTIEYGQPVVYVDWENADKYCRFVGKRLPTEAEWEHGARAGSVTEYPFGDDPHLLTDYAWYQDNTELKEEFYAHVSGLKQPNVWGLYDMQGNVMEWTSDWYTPNYHQMDAIPTQQSEEGTNPEDYPRRVVRGGAWGGLFGAGAPFQLRSAKRFAVAPWVRSFLIGFRCAADGPPSSAAEDPESNDLVEREPRKQELEVKQ